MRQASGVVMVAPILLLSYLLVYFSSRPNYKFVYQVIGFSVLAFSFLKMTQGLYSPASYQLYLVPITHSTLPALLG